ncbi:MAG: hypothetical protein ACTH31_05725, partial [Pseudoclavibacter sp.]
MTAHITVAKAGRAAITDLGRRRGPGMGLPVNGALDQYSARVANILVANDENAPLVPIDQAGYFDHVARGTAHDFRRAAITMLESMGISVEFSHHEAGPGQNEIDLRYADALTTADNLMTFRTVVKEVALEQGVFASFMPKPMADHPGSGMHTHLSLFEGDRNAFHEPGAQFELSKTARQFIAGLLVHAAEITAITNQYVNSYKRLWGGAEAPSY